MVNGQCTVLNCKGFATNTCHCTKCYDGYYYRAADTKCHNCRYDCRICGNSYCSSPAHSDCNAFVNDTCSSQECFQNNKTNCPSCPDDYYLYRGWCIKCLNSGCKCSSTNKCTACLPGRYGTMCNETCPVGCKTCYSSSYCTECLQGKYGETCDKNCSYHCKNSVCDKISGLCCTDKSYQVYSNLTNNYECRYCPENCATCTGATICTSCTPDHWGSSCQHNCTGCSNDCTDQGCTSCTSGYYNQRTINGFECIRCPDDCKTCSDDSTCDDCEYGYIVQDGVCYKGNFTTNCPVNCNNGNCNPNDGICTEGCLSGWSGANCSIKCSLQLGGACITDTSSTVSETISITGILLIWLFCLNKVAVMLFIIQILPKYVS